MNTRLIKNELCAALVVGTLFSTLFSTLGCQSPYYADRGAVAGGLTGAGVGAIVGNSLGNPLAGTAIGAGFGALTGAAVGGAIDDVSAQNRAAISAQMGRPVGQGAATIEEVVAMSRAGVEPGLITNYINSSGIARPVNAQDVIRMHQQGVATTVIDTMQRPQVASRPGRVAQGPPVVVHGDPYYCGPPRHIYYRNPYGYHHGYDPHVGFGITIGH